MQGGEGKLSKYGVYQPHQTHLLLAGKKSTTRKTPVNISSSLPLPWLEPQLQTSPQPMRVGGTLLFSPLVLGQPFHPQDRWPWVLFLELSLEVEPTALSVTFLWVQSPVFSGNGCLSASSALWAPHVRRKARWAHWAWMWKLPCG